jgi:hypothetical protein
MMIMVIAMLSFLFLVVHTIAQAQDATIFANRALPPVRFAADEIQRAHAGALVEFDLARLSATSAGARFVIAAGPAESQRIAAMLHVAPLKSNTPQAYAIRRAGNTYIALGADAAGAMYGGLDLAEAVRLKTLAQLTASDHSPHIARRGFKFNIPLDARTPSYSDNSDSAQQNIPEMWSFDFWREMIDEMARQRYNVLSLWNLHPFPSMVKVPEYPDVALDDVKRTTIPFDDSYSHNGTDMVRPAILEHLETVKQMPIADKIQFWRDVMQYAQDRGVEVYVITWNVFTFGAEGKYGITSAQSNKTTIDYFRKSVRQMVLTYPLLAGIGVTAGENMTNPRDDKSKEEWLWQAYGEGVRDALKQQPGRKFRMIHRYHMTALAPIRNAWKDYPGTFDLSYKYSVAHMYSMPNPPFAKQSLDELSKDLRMWMTVRNDDIYSFRWGDPEFARAYIRNLPGPDKLAGYYMGPDGYIWGREFLSKDPETPRELVTKKQWYSFMLWGRLSFEPSLPDSLFERTLAARFPEANAGQLMTAWASASKIIPQITRFFWGDIDLKWFPEACLSHPRFKGFYTVKHFVEGDSMPGSGILNIRTYRDRMKANQPMGGITPLEVAQSLENDAGDSDRLSAGIRRGQMSKELRLTLGDMEAMSHLGRYYAEKIRGAVDLAMGRKESAIGHLEKALMDWRKYAAVYASQYKPQLLNRVGFVDIEALTAKVAQDIEIARNWTAQ